MSIENLTERKVTRVDTSIKTADGAVKASPGWVFWIAASVGGTGGAFQLNDSLADDGTDRFDITMPASSICHFLLDPPLWFETGIYLDVPGANLTLTVGYR